MVWGPIKKQECLMFARICLPTLFGQCFFAQIFSGICFRQNTCHSRGPQRNHRILNYEKHLLEYPTPKEVQQCSGWTKFRATVTPWETIIGLLLQDNSRVQTVVRDFVHTRRVMCFGPFMVH